MQKIVTIGGGTGHYQTLRGLKNYDCDLTAIVNVADNGGHSGELRDEFGVLPPGDSRQCLLALADEGSEARDLFEYRFENGESLGNLNITVLEKKYGRAEGIKKAAKLLKTAGKVVYVSLDDFHIFAKLENGEVLEGQNEVSYFDSGSRIVELYAKPKPFVYREAADSIRQANKIVICPGDLYGSIIPNFLVEGLTDAIKESRASMIYACNIVTKQGNYGYKASDFVKEIERYLKTALGTIIMNTTKPSEETLRKYLDEKSGIVEDDLGNDQRVVRAALAEEYPSRINKIFRHNPKELARIIMSC